MKTWLILKREFSTRVRKRSFVVMTILGPVLSAAIFVLPAYLATLPEESRMVMVLDETGLMDFDKGKESLQFRYLPPAQFDLEKAKKFFQKEDDYALLYLPHSETGDPDFIARNTLLFGRGDLNLGVESYIESKLEKYIQREKLKALGVESDVLARTKTRVNIRSMSLQEDGAAVESVALTKIIIGYAASLLMYTFVFLYGAQVMRGVIEEKTTRIVEVMVSTVRPTQLMAGKILGIALVAMLQFVLWVVFGGLFYLIAAGFILDEQLDAARIAENTMAATDQNFILEIFQTMEVIQFPLILTSFIFFFIFGYLLYAAIFAAIGSAVDKEADTQQFMFPVSLPLIASLVVLIRALENPDGPLAVWFSIIPFTSPVMMMARIPFGVPVWELVLSMVLLVVTFLIMIWLAARIYRTGILMYGKKASFKELAKWITYRR